jgi:ketosteroid isomerase-like protein
MHPSQQTLLRRLDRLANARRTVSPPEMCHELGLSSRDTVRAMSQQNVEVVREHNEAVNRADDQAALALHDPESVWHAREDEPDAHPHQGRASIQDLFTSWREMFPDIRMEAEEYIDVGDFVIVPSKLCGQGAGSGIAVDAPYTFVFSLRDQKIIEVREYHTKADALEAVGLQE